MKSKSTVVVKGVRVPWEPREIEISTPPNTSRDCSQLTTWNIGKGTVLRSMIMFPDGPEGKLHVQVYGRDRQLWPDCRGDYAGNKELVHCFPPWYSLSDPPYELTIRTWNTSEQHPHAIRLHVDIARTDRAEVVNVAEAKPEETVPGEEAS